MAIAAIPTGGSPTNTAPSEAPVTIENQHKTLVSLAVLLVVVIVLVEFAGTSPDAGHIVILIMVAMLILRGMALTGNGSAQRFLQEYPWIP